MARNRTCVGGEGESERWVPRGTRCGSERPDDGESDDARVAGAGNTHLRLSAGLAFDMTPASSCVRRGRAGARRRMHESREVVAFANGKTANGCLGFLSGHFIYYTAGNLAIVQTDLLCKKTDKNMYHPSRFDRSRRRRKAPRSLPPQLSPARPPSARWRPSTPRRRFLRPGTTSACTSTCGTTPGGARRDGEGRRSHAPRLIRQGPGAHLPRVLPG